MTRMHEMAKDLGKALAQTEEYQTLRRTVSGTADDRELAELRTKLEGLEGQIEAALRGGQEPAEEVKSGYEEAVGRLQTSATYQRLVSAQANFDKVLLKMNQTIQEGIAEGGESRVIML